MSRSSILVIAFLGLLSLPVEVTQGLRILALFPLHGKSHFVMCERLAKGLADRGHQLDVYNHFPQKKAHQVVGNDGYYRDVSLAGSLPQVQNNMSFEIVVGFKNPDMERMQKMIGEPVCDLLALPVFQELIKNPPKYDLVIVEVFFQNCYLAFKRHLGGKIPMVGVVTASLFDWMNAPLGNPFNTASTPGGWSDFYNPMTFRDRLLNTLLYNMLNFMVSYHIAAQDAQISKYFGPGYPGAMDLLSDLDLVLVNSHHSIDGIKPLTPAIVSVGGLHVHDDGVGKLQKDVQSWLDGSDSGFIYVSFGSMVRIETFPLPVVEAFYSAFRAIAPVRVLMKIAKPEELPPGLPANVLTNSWLPQLQVLGHPNARLFVTHGGLMSTQESVVYGVPMVGVPLFGDQSRNIQIYVRKRVALLVKLEELNKGTMTKALQEVLGNPEYMTNIKQLSREFLDRPMSAIDTAAFWVEYLGRHGPGALRAPVTELTWWQARLLDVYGFLLIVVLVAAYVLKFLVTRIIGLIGLNRSKNDRGSKKNR